MILVRRANQQDASAIARVHIASWRTTYAGIVPNDYLKSLNESERVLQWQDWLARDVRVYVAELDGEVIGFASAGPTRELLEGCDAELYAIYLLNRAQRIGIGTTLVRTLATYLCAKDFKSMMVWVLEQNPAIHFYEKSGAVRVTSKQIEVGGAVLGEIAFKWPDLSMLASLT
ncbi:L-amino acid N-acyltransferase YncA [Granulicella aggregans]|uniref:L-amino acid N-acyltransferase YncA n=1 Tax=Granulicella aggregans TaxID=474949 RepID=A0A7W8E572_9BACT|nr:GNAT family N-acetyltransferase [Granulicella aggregans]MBB5058984.1 L-amino acid N-acyltransferase YncA [Granulicella aggregans]